MRTLGRLWDRDRGGGARDGARDRLRHRRRARRARRRFQLRAGARPRLRRQLGDRRPRAALRPDRGRRAGRVHREGLRRRRHGGRRQALSRDTATPKPIRTSRYRRTSGHSPRSRRRTCVPYRAAIEAGLAAVMPAHVIYRQVDQEPAGLFEALAAGSPARQARLPGHHLQRRPVDGRRQRRRRRPRARARRARRGLRHGASLQRPAGQERFWIP